MGNQATDNKGGIQYAVVWEEGFKSNEVASKIEQWNKVAMKSTEHPNWLVQALKKQPSVVFEHFSRDGPASAVAGGSAVPNEESEQAEPVDTVGLQAEADPDSVALSEQPPTEPVQV